MDIQLVSGDYRARIRQKGAALSELTFQNRNLIEPLRPGDASFFHGDVLAPWPNRIGDGVYQVAGKTFNARINEPERQTALHGLVFDLEWQKIEVSTSSVTLEVELTKSDAYPTTLRLRAHYTLDLNGLKIAIFAENTGHSIAPYGISIHPYLVADGESKVDEWALVIPSKEVLDVDLNRLLPIGLKSCKEMGFEFHEESIIGTRFIDHAFKFDANHPRLITLRKIGQPGVAMTFDESSKWIQIHTADRNGGTNSRRSLAVEPMTCPPDAFKSGIDLIWLNVGETTESSWRISNLLALA